MIRRISTGIPGLDSLIEGGIIQGSAILVSGTTGTGKTIFSSQFLWHGLQKGEPGVYLTLEEDPIDLKENMSVFGWNFEKYEKRDLCRIISHDPFEISDVLSIVLDAIEEIKAKRFVLDSISILGLYLKGPHAIRKKLYTISRTIKKAGCTSLIISEIPEEESKMLSRFGVEEFVTDGVIVLNYLEYAAGGLQRSLIIRKMRRTNHGKEIYPFEITEKGIVLRRSE